MPRRTSRWWLGFVLAAFLLVVIVGGFGTYLAGQAGYLPWQEEPKRSAVTPFADIPSLSTPAPDSTPASQ